jgi:type II secretory pathway pseudopilin PulG
MKAAFRADAAAAMGLCRRKGSNRGYLLLEVMAAMGIFSIGFLAVGTLMVSTTRNNSGGHIVTQATLLAEETLEDLKKEGLGSLVPGGPYTDPQNPIDEWGNSGGIYTRSWVIDDPIGLGTSRRIRVTISWERLGRTRRVELTTLTRGNGT